MFQKLMCSVSVAAFAGLAAAPAMAQTAPASAVGETVEEVVVTGSRLQASGFTTPTPVTVIGQEQFATRGAASVLDALQEMPSFRGIFGANQTTGGTYTVGQGLLDLRSLGLTRTLVLVDGRRHVPTNSDGTLDTNVIPTALIDRVDVVTGGASAAYGSDAVSGVVNFVLNDRLEGGKGTLQYGTSQRGDAEEFVANLAFGTRFAEGRGRLILGGDYSHSDPSGTIYSRDWGRRGTALVALPATRAAGLPAQLLADDQRYAIPPGSLVTSCVRGGVFLSGAACPIGNLTFDEAGQPTPFVFGSPRGGLQMVGGGNDGYNQFRNQLLRVGTERKSGLARVSYDLTDDVTAWAQLSGGGFQVKSRTSDYVNFGSIIIQRDNPFLPAALAAQMDANGVTRFNLSRLNYAQQGGVHVANTNSFWEGSMGLRGTVFGDWKWDASYTSGRSKAWYRPQGLTVLPNYLAALYVVRDAGGAPVCGPIASNPMFAALPAAQRAAYAAVAGSGCAPFNPFGPSAESQAALNYVAPLSTESLTTYDQQSAAINLAGSPFRTWAGDASVAVGAEWRRASSDVSMSADTAALVQAAAFFAGAPPLPSQGAVEVKEGYAEIGLPLAHDLPFARAVDFNGAVRITDYSSSGTVVTWKLGATWDVTDSLRLRATRSRDIRAPGISELYYRGNAVLVSASNPLTGVGTQVAVSRVNNRDLDPEKADTWAVGFVVQPTWDWARGLRASVDYYSITLNGVISYIPVQSIINGYYLGGRTDYAKYITFDASSPAGFSRVGPVLQNLNRQVARGLDINIEYATSLERFGAPGEVKVSAVGSHLARLETFDNSGASFGDMAGSVPKWGWTANLNYRLDRFSTTLTARYNSSQTYNVQLVGPDDPAYNPASSSSISKNVFPAMVYYSLQAEYAIRDDGQRRLVLYGIVDNLFDKDPPAGSFSMLAGVGSAASTLYDPYDNLGRYFKAGLRFSF